MKGTIWMYHFQNPQHVVLKFSLGYNTVGLHATLIGHFGLNLAINNNE